MENSKFVKLLSLLIAIILTFGTFGGCNKKTPESASSKEADNQKDTVEEVPKDDGYDIIFYDSYEVVADFWDRANKDFEAPETMVFNLYGKDFTVNLKEKASFNKFERDQYYGLYQYETEDGNISVRYNSLGHLASYIHLVENASGYDELAQKYLGTSERLTQEQCVQKAFDFLEAQSFDTRGYEVSEVTTNTDYGDYRINFVKYIDGIRAYDTTEIRITESGFVRFYKCWMAGAIPYYDENPFDMAKARKLLASTVIEEASSYAKKDYDEVRVKIRKVQFYSIPGKGIALDFDVLCYWYMGDDFVRESPLLTFWVTLE